MKRLIFLALVLAPALAFAAAATWSSASTSETRSVKGVCAAGTSCDAPSAATDGMNLSVVRFIAVQACADSGQTITDGASADVYYYDADSGLWGKSDLSLSFPTGARCSWAEGNSPGHGLPILAARGRIAIVPNAMAVSSGGLTLWLLAVDAQGNHL